jgi:hypothetical protein
LKYEGDFWKRDAGIMVMERRHPGGAAKADREGNTAINAGKMPAVHY